MILGQGGDKTTAQLNIHKHIINCSFLFTFVYLDILKKKSSSDF